MSAYICNDSVFSTLGAFAALTTGIDAQKAADMLKAENIRSVNYRYNDDEPVTPADMKECADNTNRAALLDMCSEYDYQSCECSDYPESAAGQLLERIRSNAVAYVPGDTTQPNSAGLIGRALYSCHGGRGYVVDEELTAEKSYSLGSRGMRPNNPYKLTIVWLPKGKDGAMRQTVENLNLVETELESHYNWPAITPAQAEALRRDCEKEQNAIMRAAELARMEREAEAEALRQRLAGVMPADCKGVIIAELQASDCDSMSDYFASHSERVLILGFSPHNRNNFAEMRKALKAAAIGDLPGLQRLADPEHSEECRENWSMGKGYYLQEKNASSYSGWKVKKVRAYKNEVLRADDIPTGEIRTAAAPTVQPEPTGKPATCAAVNLNPEKQGIEVTFPNKPTEEIREQLKAQGFKWSRRAGLWYAKQTAERLAFVSEMIGHEVAV